MVRRSTALMFTLRSGQWTQTQSIALRLDVTYSVSATEVASEVSCVALTELQKPPGC